LTGRSDVQVSIHYKFLEAYRSAKMENWETKYAFSIFLGEAMDSYSGNTYLPFTVDVETKPEGVFFKIKGEIFVKGPSQIVKKLVLSKGNEPPEIWSQVYEEALKILSSLANRIHVPSPMNQISNKGK